MKSPTTARLARSYAMHGDRRCRHLREQAGLRVGEFAQVRITDAGDHDLWAESVDSPYG